MMRKLAYLTLLVIGAAYALSFARPSLAGDKWVATYDALTGNPKSTFALNEDVNVTAYSADLVDYYIIVKTPSNAAGQLGPFTGGNTHSEIHDTDLSNETGVWYLLVGDFTIGFGVGEFNVVPFVPLGVVGVLAVCFVGVGVKLRKKA
jgi:hypothetical protein